MTVKAIISKCTDLHLEICADEDSKNHWVNDSVSVTDDVVISSVFAMEPDYATPSDDEHKVYEKVIGGFVSGMGAAPLNTVVLNESFKTTKGNEFVVVDDEVLIILNALELFFGEVVTVADSLAMAVSPAAFADSVTPSDSLSIHSTTPKEETQSVADSVVFETEVASGGMEMSVGVADDVQIIMEKTIPFTDDAVVSEVFSAQTQKGFSDSATPSDALTVGYTKYSDEPVNAQDGLFINLNDNPIILDDVVAIDVLDKTYTKNNSDQVLTTDTIEKTFSKSLTESATPTDSIDLSYSLVKSEAIVPSDDRVITVTWNRVFDDTGNISDSSNSTFTKNLNEAITVSEDINFITGPPTTLGSLGLNAEPLNYEG